MAGKNEAASANAGAKKPKTEYQQFMSEKLSDVQFMQIYNHKQRFAAAVEAWNLMKKSPGGKAGEKKADGEDVTPKKQENVKHSKFHKFVAEKAADAEFLPGQPEIDRKAAAVKEWGFGCSKCKYVRVGCTKCNPQRFADC